ncbi:MAG: phosphotransferase [bacterium]|nr:phosphotransferase [bacterium]
MKSLKTITIEEVVQQIGAWRGKQLDILSMPGGITNENYRVNVAEQPYFVSIPGAGTEFLAVDRDNKYHNTLAAAAAGVGPKIVHHLPDHHVMVLEFIQGDTMTPETMAAAGMPGRLARVLQKLHGGSRFLKDFNVFRLAEFYLNILVKQKWRIPAGYRKRMTVLPRMERAVSKPKFSSVPCTNDLVAENIIDDGHKLRLIDFDYSGNNDPCCELGNACQELQYSEDQYAELCAAYFGQSNVHLLARMHLYATISDFIWTLWGAIQHEISNLDIDFWQYATGRWQRAQGLLDSNDFPGWLEEAKIEDWGLEIC